MMVRFDKSTAPLGTCENIEVSIRHAEVKSGDLKNTQVTFTRKKVNKARRKLDDCTFFKNRGAIKPCTTTLVFGTSSGIGFILIL